MSVQPPAFGQPAPFGGGPAPEPVPVPQAEETPTDSRKTVVIAVAAGVVALGVLGGAAALVLASGGEGDVVAAVPPAPVTSAEASVEPSVVPATPLPTAVIKGRNVFEPLIAPAGGGQASAGGSTAVDVGPVATSTATTGTAAPTGSATTPPTGSPLPGGGTPLVRYVPGPTVTVTVDGEEVLVPGPTETVEVEKIVEVAVPGASFDTLSVVVEEVTERDADGALVDVSYPADFFVDDAEFIDVLPGSSFGEDKEFRYISYAPLSQSLSFIYGSSLFTVTVPLAAPEPTPAPSTTTP